jgi:hypothetical protein
MNIRIVINSLILIFIIHIIILNLNYSYTFGSKNNLEKFTDKGIDDTNSINFLMEDNNVNKNDEEFKKKMLKYIQQDYEPKKDNKFEEKNTYPVEPSNSFLSDNNVPNFESNVADTKKFYTINYDNMDENTLKSTSIDNLKNYESLNKNKDKENITIDSKLNEPCLIKEFGRESTKLPDTWKYKNELPMNGGPMNGIHGFDTLESQFAIYNPSKLNLQNSDNSNFDNIPHNDLRKPIVYEN